MGTKPSADGACILDADVAHVGFMEWRCRALLRCVGAQFLDEVEVVLPWCNSHGPMYGWFSSSILSRTRMAVLFGMQLFLSVCVVPLG